MFRQYQKPTIGISIQLVTLLSLYTAEPVPSSLAALAVLFIGLVSAWSPVSGIAVTGALLPLYHEPVQLELGQFPPAEIALWATVGGASMHMAANAIDLRSLADIRRRLDELLHSRLIWALLILCGAGAASLLANWSEAARSEAIREIRWTLLEPLILVGLLIAFCSAPRHRNIVIVAYLGGAFVFAVIALGDFLLGGGVQAAEVTRISGIYSHPNAMAMYSTRALVFGVALLVFTRRSQLHWLALAALSTILVILTFARSSLLVVSAAAIALSLRVSRRLFQVTAALAVGLGALLTALAPNRMLDGFAGGSADLRIDIWSASLAMIRDNPVFGIGPDQFFAKYAPRYVSPTGWGERFTAHAHNLILDSWLRLGIVGAVFTIVVIFVCMNDVRKLTFRARRVPAVQMAALLAITAALLQGMIDNAYFVHDLAMSAWLLAWLRYASMIDVPQEGNSSNESARHRGRRPGWLSSLRQSN